MIYICIGNPSAPLNQNFPSAHIFFCHDICAVRVLLSGIPAFLYIFSLSGLGSK